MSYAHGKEFILTHYAKNLIEFKALQLSRRKEFVRSDREEIQQDLWQAVVKQADRFDPTRASLDTFIDRVVNTAAAMILRDRRRQKRANGFQTVSLDAAAGDGDSIQPLSAQLTEDDLCRRTGNESRSERVILERERAIASALAEMPPDVRDVCRRVMGGSISSAASDLETSRRQIRKALAAAKPFVEKSGI